jgi:hypothetical protein
MNVTLNFPNEVFQNNPDPMNQSSSMDNAYMQLDAFPATEKQTSFVQSAHFGEPQTPYLPLGRQFAQYNISTEDVSSLDEISSDPSWRTKSRYAPGKGKGKTRGKLSTMEEARRMPTIHIGMMHAPSFQNLEHSRALFSLPLVT